MFIMFRNSQYLTVSSHWKSWCRLVWSTAVSLYTTALSSSCLIAFSTKKKTYRLTTHTLVLYMTNALRPLLSSRSDLIQLRNSRTPQHFCSDVFNLKTSGRRCGLDGSRTSRSGLGGWGRRMWNPDVTRKRGTRSVPKPRSRDNIVMCHSN
jgi:hypothetical protein